MLSVTMEVPSPKSEALAQHCGGSIPETVFLHFKYDTRVTLPVGAEMPGRPFVTKLVPGWCPPPKCTVPAGHTASATKLGQARVPIYYWGAPVADYAINPKDKSHRDFLAKSWVPSIINSSATRGVWFDSMDPAGPPGAARTAALVEFGEDDAYFEATQAMLREVKENVPAGSLVLGNGWASTPLEIDGYERESWMDALANAAQLVAAVRSAQTGAAQGAVQQLQYNPMFDPVTAPYGVNASFAERPRDQMLALGCNWPGFKMNAHGHPPTNPPGFPMLSKTYFKELTNLRTKYKPL